MCKLITVKVPEFLNRKFLEWQLESGERKTIEDFANLFGAKQAIVSMWMNGKRQPGEKYKNRIIEIYGDEAIQAFGDDIDLHFIQKNWDDLPPELRRKLREQAEQYAAHNESRRVHRKPRTRPAD